MAQRFYPAVLEREDEGLFALWFPDFPDAVAAGASQSEAMARAQDALSRAMQTEAEAGRDMPEPTPVEAIALPDGVDFIAYVVIGATPPNPSERVNVYLPKALIERADRAAQDWGMTRSSLFGWALTRMLEAWPIEEKRLIGVKRKKSTP